MDDFSEEFEFFIDNYAKIVSDACAQVPKYENLVSQAYYNDEYNYIIIKMDSTKFVLTRALKPYNDMFHWDITSSCIDDSIYFEHVLIESSDDDFPDKIIDFQSMTITDSFLFIQEKKNCNA